MKTSLNFCLVISVVSLFFQGALCRLAVGQEASSGVVDTNTGALGGAPTVNDLRKVVSAPVSIKGDVVTITYDWKGAAELDDFEIIGNPPAVENGELEIGPGSALKHKLTFLNNFSLSSQIALGNRMGDHLGSTQGLTIAGESYNAWFVSLFNQQRKVASEVFDPEYHSPSEPNKFLPLELSLKNGVITLNWDKVRIGDAYASDFGALVLKGGTGGNKFRKVVITGNVDRLLAKPVPSPSP